MFLCLIKRFSYKNLSTQPKRYHLEYKYNTYHTLCARCMVSDPDRNTSIIYGLVHPEKWCNIVEKSVFVIRISFIFQSYILNHSFHDCHIEETRFIDQNQSYWTNCLITSILSKIFLTKLFCYLGLCSDHCCDQTFFQ